MRIKNYYRVLQVQNTAGSIEIQKAFRLFARKYHPDINRSPFAEARFKEISEAYKVLSDPVLRREFDQRLQQYESQTQPSHESTSRPSSKEPRPSHRQNGKPVKKKRLSKIFQKVFQFGKSKPAGETTPPPLRKGDSIEVDAEIPLETVYFLLPFCFETRTPPHQAQPIFTAYKKYEIKIPPGASDGTVIRLKGQGKPSPEGGKSGDLLIRLRIAPHPVYGVEGYDLRMWLDIAPWEAALGGTFKVQTLEGITFIKVPPHSHYGDRISVVQRGLTEKNGYRAKLIVQLRIQMPKTLSPRERSLYMQLKQAALEKKSTSSV